jgi:hypothetical protein
MTDRPDLSRPAARAAGLDAAAAHPRLTRELLAVHAEMARLRLRRARVQRELRRLRTAREPWGGRPQPRI